MTTPFPSEDTAKNAVKVWSIVKSIKVAMMTLPEISTMPGQSGPMEALDARPMRALFEEHADAIWFIVPRRFLAEHMQADAPAQSLLTFSGGTDGDHVAFHGLVSAANDRAKLKGLWNAHADIAFPKGPTDPDATLLKFAPERAAFWSGGSDVLSFVVNFLEAKLTGNALVVGEHATVASAA